MIISGIELLLKKINILEEQNKQILDILREKTSVVSNCTSLVSCPIQLPMKTDKALKELEKYLQEDNHLNIFVSYA